MGGVMTKFADAQRRASRRRGGSGPAWEQKAGWIMRTAPAPAYGFLVCASYGNIILLLSPHSAMTILNQSG